MNLLDTLGHLWVSTTSAIVGVSLVIIPSITPIPVASNSTTTYQSYTIQGSYEYLNQQVNYSIKIPKNGGDITGKVTGICEGLVTGTYLQGRTPQVEGTVNAKCRMAFISQQASAKFSGKINDGEKKAYLDWVGDGFIAGKRGSVSLELISD